MKKALAIIPARGGSKGILKKNIRLVCGKPLIAWSIEAAKRAQLIEKVVVTTDCDEIASVSKDFGAEIVKRPPELATDKASSESAILHALEVLRQKDGGLPDITVFLQCTSPLTIAEDIDATVDELVANNADTALAVTLFHYFLWKKDEEGNAIGVNHDKSFRPMRQDLPPQYLETGSVYAMKTDGFLKHKHRFFGKTVFYEMPIERRHEIDEPVDLDIAGVMLREQLDKGIRK